jgi:hypothetical protein
MSSQPNGPPTAENAHLHADFIAKSAKDISGADLDYSPESLEQVDEIIEGFRQEGQSSESISGTLFFFGCYVGEVFVRNVGAVWRNSEETPMKGVAGSPIVVELPGGSICNPVGKVFKRLENGREDYLPYFYQVFAAQARGSEGTPVRNKKWWQFWKR